MIFDFISSMIGLREKSTTNIMVNIDNKIDLEAVFSQIVNQENIILMTIKSSASFITYDVVAKELVNNQLHLKGNYLICINQYDKDNDLTCSLIVFNKQNIATFILQKNNIIASQEITQILIDFIHESIK